MKKKVHARCGWGGRSTVGLPSLPFRTRCQAQKEVGPLLVSDCKWYPWAWLPATLPRLGSRCLPAPGKHRSELPSIRCRALGRAPRASPRLRSKLEKSKLLWTEADFSDLMGQGPEGCCHQSPWSLSACADLRGLPRAVRSPTTAWGTDVTAGPPATSACGTQGGDSTPGGLPSPGTPSTSRGICPEPDPPAGLGSAQVAASLMREGFSSHLASSGRAGVGTVGGEGFSRSGAN